MKKYKYSVISSKLFTFCYLHFVIGQIGNWSHILKAVYSLESQDVHGQEATTWEVRDSDGSLSLEYTEFLLSRDSRLIAALVVVLFRNRSSSMVFLLDLADQQRFFFFDADLPVSLPARIWSKATGPRAVELHVICQRRRTQYGGVFRGLEQFSTIVAWLE
jgi:hypothetical protein